jgi:Zn finger protein HypA/HybF involved in hydrogenase expression
MRYSPEDGRLVCPFCGSGQEIPAGDDIESESYESLERAVSGLNIAESEREVSCHNCGADFEMEPRRVSASCPYCDTPCITGFHNPISPYSVLPFKIGQKEARRIFVDWIGSLWFAPGDLKRFVDRDRKLTGFYLPYWMFDADTRTVYTGERGDVYYETVVRREMVAGRERSTTQRVRRVRWTPVSGRVTRRFEKFPINADETIPASILYRITPWDASSLKSYDDRFLPGFETFEYEEDISVSHERAHREMREWIEMDIRRDIGGDEQRIASLDTVYSDERVNYSLLPVWSTHFRYGGRDYYYAINGFNGRISGERPYSAWKIASLVASILAILAVIYYADSIKAFLGI